MDITADLAATIELDLRAAVAADEQMAASIETLSGLLSPEAMQRLNSELVARQVRTEEVRTDAAMARQAQLYALLGV